MFIDSREGLCHVLIVGLVSFHKQWLICFPLVFGFLMIFNFVGILELNIVFDKMRRLLLCR